MFFKTLPWTVLVLLGACSVNRTANVVPVEQSFDERMTCRQIVSEYKANKAMLAQLQNDEVKRESHNQEAVLGAVLLLNPAILGSYEGGDAARAEVLSYSQRNNRLKALAEQKSCPPLESNS